MKQIISGTTNKVTTVTNLLKKGFNNDRVIVYRRHNNALEEYAFLRRLQNRKKGFVSLIGGANYAPCLVGDSYEEVVRYAVAHRNVYVFKNMEEFMKNRHKMVM